MIRRNELKEKILTALLLILLITAFNQTFILSAIPKTWALQASEHSGSIIMVPKDYPTIQQAIGAANPGDTILVASGTYNESINIHKPISLIGGGAENTFIIGSKVGRGGEGGVIIHITSDGVKVSGSL